MLLNKVCDVYSLISYYNLGSQFLWDVLEWALGVDMQYWLVLIDIDVYD
jgi:hypothetical protein